MPFDLINILTLGLYKKNNIFLINMYKERIQIQQEHIKQIEQKQMKYYNELKNIQKSLL